MSFSLLPLLIHEADLPGAARAELCAALWADPESRTSRLEAAAALIAVDLELAPVDARALVGLCKNDPIAEPSDDDITDEQGAMQ